MKVVAKWNETEQRWSMYKRSGIFKKRIMLIGYVDAPKGAHFNTIIEEYKKRNKELKGELKW